MMSPKISWIPLCKNFGGNARLKDGSYVQPNSKYDRNTLPISLKNAHEVIQVGVVSSLAQWCDLDWKNHYLNTTNGARKYGLSDKQTAFIGFLHGITMGVTSKTKVIQENTCSPQYKEAIKTRLKNRLNNPINFTPSLENKWQ